MTTERWRATLVDGVDGSYFAILCGPPTRDIGRAWQENDARLIAAAPELLAALRETERGLAIMIGRYFSACQGRHYEGRICEYCTVSDLLSVARAAIARAEVTP